jgi:hypothetical protein
LLRPLFAAEPGGDWAAVRVLNFSIFAFSYGAFLYLLVGLARKFGGLEVRGVEQEQRSRNLLWTAGICLFVATQLCLGQVSRVNPDELVTALFFLASGMIVRLLASRNSTIVRGLALGLVFGAGFIVKAAFLPLSLGMLAILAIASWKERRGFAAVALATGVFAVIAGSYGVALSRAVGTPTLGQSGSINYAWHVNRLQKWVHWEGGTASAEDAWPSARLARLAQWQAHPPDFGTPLHPSKMLQHSPLVYGFAAPFHATYTPYYDPPYWYEGYRHFVRTRYQIIALGKSLVDLVHALAVQPIFYAVVAALVMLLRTRAARERFLVWLRLNWVPIACGLVGVMIYFPVHLEGRYIASFLAALAMCAMVGAVTSVEALTQARVRLVTLLLLLGLAGDLAAYQVPVWRNALHRKSPRNNVEWQMGEAVLAEHLPPMSQVAVIAWTANLHCDWAYIAHLEITSEIASGADFDSFWKMSPAQQQPTLDIFRKAGAVAVFVEGKPPNSGGPEWKQLGHTPMWMLRLDTATTKAQP